MKLKNRSHKRDGIGVGIIRTFSFSSDYANSFIAYDLVKTRLSKSEAEAEMLVQTLCDWCSSSAFWLLLRRFSFHLVVSDGVISGIRMLFSLNRNALHSLITTTTKMLVKPSFKGRAALFKAEFR